MKNTTKILFNEKSIAFVLEAIGMEIDKNGFVIDAKTKEYKLDVDGNKFKSKNMIGVINKNFITRESQMLSLR